MSRVSAVVSLVLAVILSGCGVGPIALSLAEGDHYQVRDGHVYWVEWSSMGGPPGRNEQPVDADASTFKAFPDLIYQHPIYGRDSENVFCRGRLLEKANPSRFRVLPHNEENYVEYATDGVWVWSQCEWIEEADGATFTRLEGGYAKDANSVFSQKAPLEDADLETFKVIYVEPKLGLTRYARDKNGVFSGIFRMSLTNPEAFRVIGGDYSTDGAAVYWTHRKVDGADPDTFEVPEGMMFGRDKSGCWRGTAQIACLN